MGFALLHGVPKPVAKRVASTTRRIADHEGVAELGLAAEMAHSDFL